MADEEETGGDDDVKEAKRRYSHGIDTWDINRKNAVDDLRFARLGEQWPENIRMDRQLAGRPVLTINKMPSFIRQVVNDARQNRPSIDVKPVDGGADIQTAQIFAGIIKNIEYQSNADVAYDTGIDYAVSCGFGFWRVNVDYESSRSFSQQISIAPIENPLTVVMDSHTKGADSEDWRWAFISEIMPTEEFETMFPGARTEGFSDGDQYDQPWWDTETDGIRVAEYFKRREKKIQLVRMSNGMIFDGDELADNGMLRASLDAQGVTVEGEREAVDYEVIHQLITGAEVLEETNWAGRYIPIVPVYGEDINVEGRRHFRSLIRDARDPQQIYNYWRPLALDTPIPTPTGWTTMGAVKVGETVFDETGSPTKVIGKSPVHVNRDCYRVEFGDGSEIIADGDHPWVVEERTKRGKFESKKVTTVELVPDEMFISTAKPLQCADINLPIDPYVLGFWLGDGDSASYRVTPGDQDFAEICSHIEAAGYTMGAAVGQASGFHKSVGILGLRTQLRALGVLNNKHIPAQYLRASEAQRWSLLQGLMDSDGSIHQQLKQCTFTNANPRIAESFAELLRSLGIKAVSILREGRRSALVGADAVVQKFYQFSFSAYPDEPVFRLGRKRSIHETPRHEMRRRTKRHAIRSVTPVESVPVQCIGIDAPSHLFLAGEAMVPTHNSTSTELLALSPKVPWIGPKGAFKTDAEKWSTANTKNHSTLEYDGQQAPTRVPFDPMPAGAVHEALNATDDMKAVLGMYDASLGARSNETSGRAIMFRQREGDTATFHFIDNLTRAIRCTGKILVDLIPKIYTEPKIIRIMGDDLKPQNVSIGPAPPGQQPTQGQQPGQSAQMPGQEQPIGMDRVFDLTVGNYDVAVTAGPSFTTKREETAAQMIEFLRVFPQAGPLMGDILAKNLDWKDADKLAERLAMLLPPQARGEQPGPDPEAQAVMGKAQAEIAAGQMKTEAEIQQGNAKAMAKMENDRQAANQKMAQKRDEAILDALIKVGDAVALRSMQIQ